MAFEGQAPTLSVLVLNYNYGRFLGECIESILAQTFEDFEVIVLDDASSDDSLEVATRYAGDPRLRVVAHEVNRGFVPSLIEGTNEHSRGEFLMVISADDLAVTAQAFEMQLRLLRADESLGACINAYEKRGPGPEREVRRLLAGTGAIPGPAFLLRQLTDREFTILHSGTMIRAEAYRRAGGYRSDLRNYTDLAIGLALGRQGPVGYVDQPLYAYRVHPAQFSGKRQGHREVLREGLTLLESEAVEAQAAGLKVNRRQALRTRIADLALADAFASRRRGAFERCLDGAALAPAVALTSGGWWLALARAALGARGWKLLRTASRQLPGRRGGFTPG